MVKYIFYRILGNDLPPRHRKGQTLANLKIILEREPALAGAENRWIVNRIVDPPYEKKITALLDKHGQQYRVIPFDRKKFLGIPAGRFRQRLDEMIGINKARNLALKEGRRLAPWVMVFDGNCFFTAQGWKEVVEAPLIKKRTKYIIVSMIRMGMQPVTCEPQIIFSRQSRERFNESLAYGQAEKAELLCRLGVPPGAWVRQPERFLVKKSKDSGLFTSAGRVWRLPSGNAGAEHNPLRREQYRNRGIRLLMDKIGKHL